MQCEPMRGDVVQMGLNRRLDHILQLADCCGTLDINRKDIIFAHNDTMNVDAGLRRRVSVVVGCKRPAVSIRQMASPWYLMSCSSAPLEVSCAAH